MNPIISVKELVKDYGTLRAVDGISFEVFEGEIFGLLGPNGAGKTTTLEIIETLREPTSGTVTVCGLSIRKEADAIKQQIGVQLQAAGYYPSLTLIELIRLFAGLYNRDVDAEEILGKVALIDKAKAKYKELSGGQKQRFSIATTLINQPRVVFLDEPTTGLHFEDINVLLGVLNLIVDKGNTVLVIEHNLDVIKTADWIIDMGPEGGDGGGRIIAEGTPEDVAKVKGSYTGKFLGPLLKKKQ